MDADFLLLHRMRHGNDQAIEDFVRKYYPMNLRYCQLHIQDLGYAEDLTQETFARFFRTLHQYQHYGKAANYLYVIAGNLCRDHHKRNGLSDPQSTGSGRPIVHDSVPPGTREEPER